MSVYVDEIRQWPTPIRCFRTGSCHLTADTDAELHAFARRLRLKAEWFQPKSVPHYDLTPEKRARAVSLGAFEVPAREQAERRIAIRSCTSPNGRTDGHNVYITIINGRMSCLFCKQPLYLRELRGGAAKAGGEGGGE